MQRCQNCGQSNTDDCGVCLDCGTVVYGQSPSAALPPVIQLVPPILPTIPPIIRERRFGAGYATLALLAYLGTQLASGMVVGAAYILIKGVQSVNPDNPAGMEAITRDTMVPATILGMLAGGVAVILMGRLQGPGRLRDGGALGAAWLPGSWKAMAQGLGLGLFTGIASIFINVGFQEHTKPTSMGPLAQMAITPGLHQFVWICVALLLAPLIEELLFRGVVYSGYRRSLGPAWAAFLTTGIFVSIHITEMIHYWPSVFGITALALVALQVRLRMGAIGPAIAAHVGYNAVVVGVVLYSTRILVEQ